MKPVPKWTVATRTANGGPWHLGFSARLFDTYEGAACLAFELNEGGGYLHKPVVVTVAALEPVEEWDG